jgi:hypothetical protein
MTSQCPPVDRLFIVPRRETLATIIASINENIPLNSPTSTKGQDFANNINSNLKTGLMKQKEMIGVGGKQLFQSYKSGKGKVEKLIENCNNSDGQEGDIFSQYILGMENSADVDRVYYLKLTVLEASDLPGKNVKEGKFIYFSLLQVLCQNFLLFCVGILFFEKFDGNLLYSFSLSPND